MVVSVVMTHCDADARTGLRGVSQGQEHHGVLSCFRTIIIVQKTGLSHFSEVKAILCKDRRHILRNQEAGLGQGVSEKH